MANCRWRACTIVLQRVESRDERAEWSRLKGSKRVREAVGVGVGVFSGRDVLFEGSESDKTGQLDPGSTTERQSSTGHAQLEPNAQYAKTVVPPLLSAPCLLYLIGLMW